MDYPPLVNYNSEAEYREHYVKTYCQGEVVTFDGIKVRFRKSRFEHAFYESSRRDGNKDALSEFRARRIDWIQTALEDPDSERYEGHDRKRRRYSRKRRVVIVRSNYVVIVDLTSDNTAEFVTAFVDRDTRGPKKSRTIDKIRSAPKWE